MRPTFDYQKSDVNPQTLLLSPIAPTNRGVCQVACWFIQEAEEKLKKDEEKAEEVRLWIAVARVGGVGMRKGATLNTGTLVIMCIASSPLPMACRRLAHPQSSQSLNLYPLRGTDSADFERGVGQMSCGQHFV